MSQKLFVLVTGTSRNELLRPLHETAMPDVSQPRRQDMTGGMYLYTYLGGRARQHGEVRLDRELAIL
jgi:hypothetical protein